MMKIIAIVTILGLSASGVSTDEQKETPAITEPIPLLIWAATDPSEDSEVGKINAPAFYLFTEKHRSEFLDYFNRKDILGITEWLHQNAEESGTKDVIWTKVFAKIVFKSLTGQTEEKEHGVPSLAAWAVRNTGVGTDLAVVDRRKLVAFILNSKDKIHAMIRKGDIDGLVNFLEDNKAESGANSLNWKPVIKQLKDERSLFKYTCGVLGVRLCDATENQ